MYDLDDAERICHCYCDSTKIGEEKTEQLEFIPAQVQVIEHIRLKYVGKKCEETIKLAPLPLRPISKSIAAAGLQIGTVGLDISPIMSVGSIKLST